MKKNRVQQKFLDELRKFPIVQVACERCSLSRQTIYRWRKEDKEFSIEMEVALNEGEELANDLCESQLFALVKDKNFQAIKYRLDKCHPKYRKPINGENTKPPIPMEVIIDALDLTDMDFVEENYPNTLVRISRYLQENNIG